MASLFQTTPPDWEASLSLRGYEYDPFPASKREGAVDPRDESDLVAARPFPRMQIAGPNDRANRRIGCALMIMSALIVIMMAVQFLRSYVTGVL